MSSNSRCLTPPHSPGSDLITLWVGGPTAPATGLLGNRSFGPFSECPFPITLGDSIRDSREPAVCVRPSDVGRGEGGGVTYVAGLSVDTLLSLSGVVYVLLLLCLLLLCCRVSVYCLTCVDSNLSPLYCLLFDCLTLSGGLA